MYLMIEFPTVAVDGIMHYIVHFEQDGDEINQFRAMADIVTVPDQEILKVFKKKTKMFQKYQLGVLQGQILGQLQFYLT